MKALGSQQSYRNNEFNYTCVFVHAVDSVFLISSNIYGILRSTLMGIFLTFVHAALYICEIMAMFALGLAYL